MNSRKLPDEVAFVAIMDRVGGYESYKLLEQDARAFDLVVVFMQAESEARLILGKDG